MILFPVFPPPIDLYVACKSKIIPTIHDTAFLHYRNTLNFAAKYYLTPKYKLALKHADCIISISETVRKQLEDYTELPVINLGENISGDFYNASEKASSICLKKWNLKPCEYIISVSTLEPRKNIKYLLDVFHDFITKKNLKLVLVGRKGWSKDDELQELLKQYAENIVFTSYVETTELFSLYRFANAFVLLSLDEGFGRTPLEAIACGCRKILVSDIDIFHETLGSSANYLPLYDANKCRMLLKKFASFRNVEDTLKIPFSVIEDSLKNWDLLKLKH